jgi:hypothetical protein
VRRLVLLCVLSCAGDPPLPVIPTAPEPIIAIADAAPPPVMDDAGAEAGAPKRPVVIEGPPAPAKQPIDEKLKVDGGVLLLGSSPTEVWLHLNDGYTVVVDRATGCATEGYPLAPALKPFAEGKANRKTALEDADVVSALRDMVGLGRRFGAGTHRFLSELTWSADGRHIFVSVGHVLFRSADGGRSFARVDDESSSRLAMSTDGKHLVYERGRDYVSLPTDRSRGPKRLTSGQTFFLEATTDGRARFTRSDTDVCLDTFELGTPALEKTTCVNVPPQANAMWTTREWEAVSPSGKYGVVKWEEARKNLAGVPALTYIVNVVDLATSKIVKTVTDMRAEVDDEGNMVMQSMSEGGGDHTYYQPLSGAKKLLGNHYLLAWREKTAILGVHRVASLGARKCDLVKLVKTP